MILLSDVDDKELLDFIRKLGVVIEREEDEFNTINFSKLMRVKKIYYALQEYFDCEANVDISICQPFKSSASISVSGKEIVIEDVSLLQQYFSRADNFHVYSKVDGSIVLNLSFEGIMR